MSKMKRKSLLLMIAIFLAMGSGLSLFGQISSRETGSIRGVITDEEGVALPGVGIVVSGPSLMGKASDVTRADGTFRILLLPPGVYTMTVELPGFQTYIEEGIEVRVGSTITRNIKLGVKKMEEEVTVVGVAPVVDVKASKTQQIYKADLIQNLPISRNLNSIITLTPEQLMPVISKEQRQRVIPIKLMVSMPMIQPTSSLVFQLILMSWKR